MAVTYNKITNYQAEINKAIQSGDYVSAKTLEQQRNAKIAGEGMKDQNMSATFQNYSDVPAYVPAYVPKQPTYTTGADMAKNLGLNYNYQNILNKYDNATRDEYAAKDKEYAKTEGQFYNNMYGTQATALDAIKKSQARAIATGASRGLQSANELSSLLGLQEESVMGATDLAQQRNMLKDKETAAYSQNVVTGSQEYNNMGQALGSLINGQYAADVQNNVGIMEYFKGLDQNQKNLEGTVYNANQNLIGTKHGADQQLAGVDLSSARTLQGTTDYNNKFLQGSLANASASRYNTNVNAGLQRELAAANTPEAVTSLIRNAKNEDEYIAILSRQGIAPEFAQTLWASRNTALAKGIVDQLVRDFMTPDKLGYSNNNASMSNSLAPQYDANGLPLNAAAREEQYGFR